MRSLRSENIDKVAGALAQAQGTYKPLAPNRESAAGSYADLNAILDATRNALSQNGIAFLQETELLDEGSGASLLYTTIAHASGQYISSVARLVIGKTERSTGTIQEIIKRRQACNLLGIAPSPYDPYAADDNAEELTEHHILEQLKKPKKEKDLDPLDTITKERYHDLLIELEGYDEITKGILETYDVQTLADVPNTEYHSVLAKIRRLKKTHDEYLKKTK